MEIQNWAKWCFQNKMRYLVYLRGEKTARSLVEQMNRR